MVEKATAHLSITHPPPTLLAGNTLENVLRNPSLNELVGGVGSVTLGDEGARARGSQKTVLERQGPPAFSCVVEMISRTEWIVHLDTGRAVDVLLSGTTRLMPCCRPGKACGRGMLICGGGRECT